MGLIGWILDLMFGGGRNLVRDTAEVFIENAEARAGRAQDLQQAALAQFGAEFLHARRGRFDRFVDGLNRLPRPALAFGTLGLFVAAMTDPAWFSERMRGVALVPDPLWWLMGAIVSFYFGARHQAKGQEFQEKMIRNLVRHRDIPEIDTDAGNPALEDWRRAQVISNY